GGVVRTVSVDPSSPSVARGAPPLVHGPTLSCAACHLRGGDRPDRAAVRIAARLGNALRSLFTAPFRRPIRNGGAAVAWRAARARCVADRSGPGPVVRSRSPDAEFCASRRTGYGFCRQPPVGPWGFDALGQMGRFVRRCTAPGGLCRDQPISEMYGRLELSIPRPDGDR